MLVVEDNPYILRSLERALRNHRFHPILASDGRTALEIAAKEPLDIAIVDLGLPVVNGFEVIAALKQSFHTRLPVIAISSRFDLEARVQAFEVGADDFLTKPIAGIELLRRLEAFRRTQLAYLETQKAHDRAEHSRLYAAEAAALLAHDLNNGLAASLCNLQFLQSALSLGGDMEEALSATVAVLFRMGGLVSNFVDISRFEDDAIKLVLSEVCVSEMLHHAAAIHVPAVRDKAARIVVQADEQVRTHLDRALIERVIHNLAGNATRYVDDRGEIVLRASVGGDDPKQLFIEVANSGPAIPAAVRSTLFQKYRVGGDKSKRGMGLYFCRLACEAHGGTIAIDSDARYGTVFRLSLPLA